MSQPASDPRTPLCSVVIATWNTRDLVADALASLTRHSSQETTEIIVVDNGSSDGTCDLIRRQFPGVILIQEEKNTGYAPANNRGMRAARGRYVLLLGSDTVVRANTIAVMSGFLDAHADVSAVACRLVNPDGSPQMSCRRFPRLRDAVATYLSLHILAPRYTMKGFDFHATQEVEQPAATCLMVRREVLGRLGGFDEAYAILYNDVDLCRRLKNDGGRIFFLGDTEVVHHGSRTTRTAPPEVRLEMYRNILRYFRQYHGQTARWVLTPILIVRLLAATRSALAFRLVTPDSGGWAA